LKNLDIFGVTRKKYDDCHYTADAIETVCTITGEAVRAGLMIFNCISVEDILMRREKVEGLVINWSPVEMTGLHVDPIKCSRQIYHRYHRT
jgi:sulfide-dependent adenosine diphosphate thiazole synthase